MVILFIDWKITMGITMTKLKNAENAVIVTIIMNSS